MNYSKQTKIFILQVFKLIFKHTSEKSTRHIKNINDIKKSFTTNCIYSAYKLSSVFVNDIIQFQQNICLINFKTSEKLVTKLIYN